MEIVTSVSPLVSKIFNSAKPEKVAFGTITNGNLMASARFAHSPVSYSFKPLTDIKCKWCRSC